MLRIISENCMELLACLSVSIFVLVISITLIYIVIHLFDKYLLNIYNILKFVLGAADTIESNTSKVFGFHGIYFLKGRI